MVVDFAGEVCQTAMKRYVNTFSYLFSFRPDVCYP